MSHSTDEPFERLMRSERRKGIWVFIFSLLVAVAINITFAYATHYELLRTKSPGSNIGIDKVFSNVESLQYGVHILTAVIPVIIVLLVNYIYISTIIANLFGAFLISSILVAGVSVVIYQLIIYDFGLAYGGNYVLLLCPSIVVLFWVVRRTLKLFEDGNLELLRKFRKNEEFLEWALEEPRVRELFLKELQGAIDKREAKRPLTSTTANL